VLQWCRQHPGVTIDETRYVDGFELDIVIHPKLIIEVDGRHHWDPAHRIADEQRDRHLERRGYCTIRVAASICKEDFLRVLSEAGHHIPTTISPTISLRSQ
jgi:very-short-patch-repair endonuclease